MSRRSSATPTFETEAALPVRRRRPTDGSGCELCRVPNLLTFHHLIPRKNHHKTWFREHFGLVEMRARGAWLCRTCHGFIHEHFDEGALGRRLNTLESLREEPLVIRHLTWATKQKAGRKIGSAT